MVICLPTCCLLVAAHGVPELMLAVHGPGQVLKPPTLLLNSSPCWFLNPGGWDTPGAKCLTPSLGWGRLRKINPARAGANPRSNPHWGNLGAPNPAPSFGWLQFVGCKGCCTGPCVFCLVQKALNFDFLSDNFPFTCLALKLNLLGFLHQGIVENFSPIC